MSSSPETPSETSRRRATDASHLPGPEGCTADEALDRFIAWVAAIGIEPYPAQEQALLELWAGRHVVLNTPTGSGKSLVALGLHFKGLCEGKTSYYTSPIKALASEKFFSLCDELGADRVGMLTGDAAINAEGRSSAAPPRCWPTWPCAPGRAWRRRTW
jgi:superfamily II RNA helicase